MPELKFSLLIELDGQPVANSPIIRRYNVTQNAGPGLTLTATPDSNSSSFHGIAAATMAEMQIFFLTTDNDINLKINQNTQLPLDAGGLILILGCDLTQGTPSNNITYNNPSSTDNATLGIIAAGP